MENDMKNWMAACCMGLLLSAPQAYAASSSGCENGGFTVLGKSGAQAVSVAPGSVASTFRVQGRYVQFDVDAASFGVLNYAMTGVANKKDITGGRATPVFDSKLPDHRGLFLNSAVTVELSDSADIVLTRTGPGLTMKIQAKDCANGGIFQMEVARADETKTVFTHKLAQSAFYFDNRNFRNREGEVVPFKDTTITRRSSSAATARSSPTASPNRCAPTISRPAPAASPASCIAAACRSGRSPAAGAWGR
jgi:hypothetical protein